MPDSQQDTVFSTALYKGGGLILGKLQWRGEPLHRGGRNLFRRLGAGGEGNGAYQEEKNDNFFHVRASFLDCGHII